MPAPARRDDEPVEAGLQVDAHDELVEPDRTAFESHAECFIRNRLLKFRPLLRGRLFLRPTRGVSREPGLSPRRRVASRWRHRPVIPPAPYQVPNL